ncbi:MAG: DPP IV N-terminal domain-containing protein [Parvularculaceae bacterium]
MIASCKRYFAVILAAAALAGCGESASQPELTHADYERAEQFFPENIRNFVRNAAPAPHWIGESDRFWYLREEKEGFSFVTVDAVSGESTPSFNHEAIARVLSVDAGEEVSPARLPFSSFDYRNGESAIAFTIGAKAFECEAKTAICSTSDAKASDPSAIVSPDGARAVFERDDNLWLRDLATGEERALTRDGTADFPYRYTAFKTTYVEERRDEAPSTYPGAAWSPDGRYLLAVRTDNRGVERVPYVVEYLPPDSERPIAHEIPMPTPADAKDDRYHLVLIDLADGGLKEVGGGAIGFNDYAPYWAIVGEPGWDIDGGELYLVTSSRDSRVLGVVAVDLKTGESRAVLEERDAHYLNLNPMDYQIPNVRLLPKRGELIWWSERSGWGALYRYDAKTGELKNAITSGDWTVFDIMRVDEEAGVIYFTAGGREAGRNPYYRHLYRVDLDGGNLKLLTPEDADHAFWNFPVRGLNGHDNPPSAYFSPSGRYFVDTYSTIADAPKTVVRSSDGDLTAKVVEADASALHEVGWSPPERFVAKSADGKYDTYGVILKPTNFDPALSYPVIEQIYAGPQVSFAPQGFTDSLGSRAAYMQALAELGFVIVIQDGRGTPRRSRDFHMAMADEEDSFALIDHVEGVKAAAATRPYMDIDRVGITGLSFGGYASMRAILLFPDFYKAAVSIAGPQDYRTMISSISVERFFGAAPPRGSEGDVYARVDNIHLADRLEGKLLLIAGEIDQNVPFNQTVAICDALIKANKDFDLVLVPGAAHSVGYHPYAMRRVGDFFVRNLQHREPPEPFVP